MDKYVPIIPYRPIEYIIYNSKYKITMVFPKGKPPMLEDWLAFSEKLTPTLYILATQIMIKTDIIKNKYCE